MEQTSMGTPQETDKKKRFILVVDNSQRDASYTAMLVQNLGYNSITVRSAEEALEFIAIARPSLVIAELILPLMNGMDLAEHLSKMSETASLPMIIQTRFKDQETEDRCRNAIRGGCLNKPVQVSELYRAVQQALEPTPRLNIRIPTFLNAAIEDSLSGTEFVTMLSDEGLFLKTFEPRKVGSYHTVTFLMGDRIIRTYCVVLYIYRFDENPDKEPGMGMKFLYLSPVDKDVVQEYIREHVSPAIMPEAVSLAKEA